MKLKLFLFVIVIFPIFLISNEYQSNLMIFTKNSLGKSCTTPPRLIFKGNYSDYAAAASEAYNIILEITRNGKSDEAKRMYTNSSEATKNFLYGSAFGISEGLRNSTAQTVKGATKNAGNGLAMGIAAALLKNIYDSARKDNQYLYITECNAGTDSTRLITYVLSNDKMEEAQWLPLAKEDQERDL